MTATSAWCKAYCCLGAKPLAVACACIHSQDTPLFFGSAAQSRVRLVGVPREGDHVNASRCVRSDSPPAAPVEASMHGTAALVLEPNPTKKPPPSEEINKVLNPCGSDTALAAPDRPSSVPYAALPAGEHSLPGAQVPPCLDAKAGGSPRWVWSWAAPGT